MVVDQMHAWEDQDCGCRDVCDCDLGLQGDISDITPRAHPLAPDHPVGQDYQDTSEDVYYFFNNTEIERHYLSEYPIPECL